MSTHTAGESPAPGPERTSLASPQGGERLAESLLDHAPGSSVTELAELVYGGAKSFGIVGDDIVVLAMVCARGPGA